MRLDILYDYVDHFIICESKISHSGKIKKDDYIFNKQKKLYEKFLDKIIFIPFDETNFTGVGDTAKNNKVNDWPNENKQRQWMYNEIKKFDGETLVAISDVDEIWDPSNIQHIKNNVETKVVCGVIQTLTYYYINCLKEQPWRGTYFIKRKDLNFNRIQHLRNLRNRLPSYVNGGWHFSWLGDVDKIKEKFQCIAEHDIIEEHCTEENIKNCITNISDLFGRNGHLGNIKSIDINDKILPKNIKHYVDKFPEIYYSK